jgi:cell division transport system permease protein
MKSSSPLLFAPSFRHQKLGWLFIAIVVIMVYIATFAMAAEAALSSISLSRNQGLVNHLTVEIPAVEDESSVPQAERVKQAVAVLRATPDITDVRPVPEEETMRLLEPWISQPDLLKKLPLPALIDVERRDGGNLTSSALEDRLRATVSDARVDDHAMWLADLAHLVGSLSALAGFMIVLTGLALMIAIALICRAVMATERDTVELLHVMGAADGNIARHFQSHAWRLAWPGALAGFLLAVLNLVLLLFFIRHVVDLSTLQVARWAELTVLVILVPFAAVIAASLSARLSVLRLLRSFP